MPLAKFVFSSLFPDFYDAASLAEALQARYTGCRRIIRALVKDDVHSNEVSAWSPLAVFKFIASK